MHAHSAAQASLGAKAARAGAKLVTSCTDGLHSLISSWRISGAAVSLLTLQANTRPLSSPHQSISQPLHQNTTKPGSIPRHPV